MSPSWRKLFGWRNAPTPAGVPVMTAVPAGTVVPNWVRKSAFVDYRLAGQPGQRDENPPTLAHVTQDPLRVEDHVFCELSYLAGFTVDSGHDIEGRAVPEDLRADQGGADGCKLVEGLGEEELTS